jgi:hypothetical protein
MEIMCTTSNPGKRKAKPEGPSRREHLVMVFYLTEALDSAAMGAVCGEAIRLVLEILDPPPVEITAYRDRSRGIPDNPQWQTGEYGLHVIEMKGVSQATSDRLDRLRTLPADATWLTGESLRRGASDPMVDFWWTFTCKGPETFSAHEPPVDARLQFDFNIRLFKDENDERARQLVDALVALIATRTACYHGHVEVASEQEIIGGAYYGTIVRGAYPWQRLVNQAVWRDPNLARQEHVRDVYWGNYLGPTVARRFDPDGETCRQYLDYEQHPKRTDSQYIIRFDNSGLFLATSQNPLRTSAIFTLSPWSGVREAAWLHREYIRRGILA